MAEVVFSPDHKTNRVKVVAGEVALDASNPTPISVAGKLRTIVSVKISLRNASTPGVGTSILTYDISDETVNVYAWKVTSSSVTTLIASDGTETFSYEIVGF